MIFMDVQMPELDGLEAARRIRVKERGLGMHTPIVAMTAHAMASDKERCLNAGMDDYLAKPISQKSLVEVIDRVVSPVKASPSQPALG